MTKREAKLIALRLAYEAVQKAVDCGPEPGDGTDDPQVNIELDHIAQSMFDRWYAFASKTPDPDL